MRLYKLLFLLFTAGLVASCQFLGPNSEEIARQKQITQLNFLFEQIDQDIAAHRLSRPGNNNALEKLQQVIKLSPDHPTIPSIKDNIAQAYLNLIPISLKKNQLDTAQHYLDKAKTISASAEGMVDAEKLIADYIIEQKRLAKLRESELKEKQAAEAKALARKKQLETLARQEAEINRLTIIRLNQTDINARSKFVGVALDKVSPDIVKKNSPIIIQAQSNRDYKWLAALLRTSIYFIDSDFTLSAEPEINTSETPRIRYAN